MKRVRGAGEERTTPNLWRCVAETAAIRRDGAAFVATVCAQRSMAMAAVPSRSASTADGLHGEYMQHMFDTVQFGHFDCHKYFGFQWLYEKSPLPSATRRGRLTCVEHRCRGAWHLQWSDGVQSWMVGDLLHRVDGPAITWPDGDAHWRIHGKLHRDGDLPAVVLANGTKMWFHDGKLHRDHGAPAIERHDGFTAHFTHGQLDRLSSKAANDDWYARIACYRDCRLVRPRKEILWS